jgi:outer membrane protein OmpA-like peptidoglycan-associated protein
MTRPQPIRLASTGILLFFVLASLSTIASAQTTKIQGMIKERSGATLTVQPPDTPGGIVVLLTDQTQVGQIQGALKSRRKQMSMAALIPGLEVQVEGTYNGLNQLEAKVVKFKGNDLERAQSIQAGLHQTRAQADRNRTEIEKQKTELDAQAEALRVEREKVAASQAKIAANQENISANAARIAANKAAVEAAIARFGQLDDYYILDEVTVLFANGKVALEPQYKPQLMQLAQKAKTIDAYMIQVTGFASSSGSVALNQKLSEDRAASVTNYLVQDCHIPMTNLMAPAAMGESRQIAKDKKAEAEAENRRVVVRILQNKGISGLHAAQ